MPNPHIPTAAEIRGRLDLIGSQQARAEVKDAIVRWQQHEGEAGREAREYVREHKLSDIRASDKRALRACMTAKDELADLLDVLEPQRVVGADFNGDGLETRGIDGPHFGLDGESEILAPAEWAEVVATKMHAVARAAGTKAVVSGSLTVPTVLTDVAPLPEQATSLAQLLPRKSISELNYAYLQQTVRTNNAAPVADGNTKPTSVFTFDEIEGKAEVVAHLSEPFPIRYVEDHSELVRILQGEMARGVEAGIEAQVVNGNGTSPQFDGLLGVAGTTPVAFAVDNVTTLRRARTALQVLGERPTAYCLNPGDVEALDLTREYGSDGAFLALEDRVFGRLPVVPSLAIPQGTGVLADWAQTRLYLRSSLRVDTDTSGPALFDKNLLKLRAEARANVAWLRPQAVAIIELSDASA